MSIVVKQRPSQAKDKIYYSFEWGRCSGQRKGTVIYTYSKPKNQLKKNHNKEALGILNVKKSQLVLEMQSINSGFTPQHKIKANFLDYYAEFVKNNSRTGNRHLANSLTSLKKFIDKEYLAPIDVSENFCERFRQFLLDKYNGETPANYFSRFKRVLEAARKDGYFKESPASNFAAKSKANKKVKDILESGEYLQLINTPCLNFEVKKAFVFSLYTGFSWVDVKPLKWESIKRDDIIQIIQEKSNVPLELPLHSTARKLIGERKTGLIFQLPTANGANKVLAKWCDDAGLDKHITWHCARHSFSVLLQDKGIDIATVAVMLGHTSTKYVHKTYKRYRKANAIEAINKLPSL